MYKLYAKQWTEGSIFCYKRGCRCEDCYYKDIIENPCRMKQTVMELVRVLGKPKEGLFTNRQQQIIEAILDGVDTREEIAERLNTNISNIQSFLNKMYVIAQANGFIYTKSNNRLPEFIKWVRGK